MNPPSRPRGGPTGRVLIPKNDEPRDAMPGAHIRKERGCRTSPSTPTVGRPDGRLKPVPPSCRSRKPGCPPRRRRRRLQGEGPSISQKSGNRCEAAEKWASVGGRQEFAV